MQNKRRICPYAILTHIIIAASQLKTQNDN